ncbi:hypothetical protein Vretimale_3916 [Volvox reticuliferus]|uniref:HP domain-containing protein n=1 Tax=Volvox reticuliferus TaxID=1737510 RepID=A0A8J4BYU6_9CHLO|nr:hypothetical protein Vretifemale_1520 [Volvox reticuliferus]GIL98555.1 hypothetical protein Vretimale_3916 [Volvox reticuliferus]
MTQQEAKAASGDDGIGTRDTIAPEDENGSRIVDRVKVDGDPVTLNVVNTNPTDVAGLGDAGSVTTGHQAPLKSAKGDNTEHDPVTVGTASSPAALTAPGSGGTNVMVTSEEPEKGQHTSTPGEASGSEVKKFETSDFGAKQGDEDSVFAKPATPGNPSDTGAGISAADPDHQNGTADEPAALAADGKLSQKDVGRANSESTKQPVASESRERGKQDSLSKEKKATQPNQTSEPDATTDQDLVESLWMAEEAKATVVHEQEADEAEAAVTHAPKAKEYMKAAEVMKVADEKDAQCNPEPLKVASAEVSTTAANTVSSVGSPKGAPAMTPPGTVQALSRRLSSNSLVTPPVKATSSEKLLASGGSGSVSAAPFSGRATKSPSGLKSGEASPVSTHDTKNTINVSQLLKLGAFKLQPLKDFVTYAELQRLRVEDGIDATRKEDYLNDEEFQEVFGMGRDTFKKQPAWRQAQAKKKANLF